MVGDAPCTCVCVGVWMCVDVWVGVGGSTCQRLLRHTTT